MTTLALTLVVVGVMATYLTHAESALWCTLVGLVRSARCRARVTGHDDRDVDCRDPNLDISRCTRCHRFSVSYRHRQPWRDQ